MSAVATRHIVTVQLAIEESVYYTMDEPRFVSVEAPATENLPIGRVVFLEFTPTNGYHPGKSIRIPMERVISIQADTREQ